MSKEDQIREYARRLRLNNLKNQLPELLEQANQEEPSYLGFLDLILGNEVKHRDSTIKTRRIKQACFPDVKTLEEFVLEKIEGLSKKNLNQLKECDWIEKKYNLMLIGPPGIGKTHLAIALGMQAIEKGYSVSFVTVKELVDLLSAQELNVRDQARVNRLYSSHLNIIDEVGYYPFSSVEAGHFFHFLNTLHNQTSFLLTSNKQFNQWPEFFGDEDLVLAALDRLLFHCDILKLKGDSFRLENRSTLLE